MANEAQFGTKDESAVAGPLLSYIIPCYNVDKKDLFDNLSMVNAQCGLLPSDLDVIIVDDASAPEFVLPESFYQEFENLQITVVQCKDNGGPGVARQIGIDYSHAPYVMFADADDSLYSCTVITDFLREIKKHEAAKKPLDFINSDWYEETGAQSPYARSFVLHENDGTWMHGKVFRKAFLTENNLTFTNLRVHEDLCFNRVAIPLARNSEKINTKSYLWKYRPNSITRKNGASYSHDSIAMSVKAADVAYSRLMNEHADRYDPNEYDDAKLRAAGKFNVAAGVVGTIYYVFFTAQSWLGSLTAEQIKPMEDALADFYMKYRAIYDAYPQNLKVASYSNEKTLVLRQMPGFIENEALDQFLWRVSSCRKMDLARMKEIPADPKIALKASGEPVGEREVRK